MRDFNNFDTDERIVNLKNNDIFYSITKKGLGVSEAYKSFKLKKWGVVVFDKTGREVVKTDIHINEAKDGGEAIEKALKKIIKENS